MSTLSIGMATYKDFDGLYFTIQSLRMYHDLRDVEFVVIDNYGCDDSQRFVQSIPGAKYVRARDVVGTSAPRDRVFAEATSDYVLCCDSHVEFAPGAIAALLAHFAAIPDTRDLIQGPLLYDDLRSISTHFDPVWSDQMWGTWGTDPRGLDPAAPAFAIPSQGLGMFACRRDAWLGFNPRFRGFGGEEGYIHEKFRQSGGRSLCLPGLRWMHRFGRPNGVPYPLRAQDKFRNYIIGHSELGLDLAPIVEHFSKHLSAQTIRAVLQEILGVDAIDLSTAASGVSPAIVDPPPTTPPADLTPVAGLPLVSCICATYNRAPDHLYLIEEAIESFLRQDYPNKELIILNDTPGQELVCDAPGVRVINAPNRLPSLGAKHNLAISASHGELIAIWDDDDINLPWRLSLSVERLGDADYFNPGSYWFRSGDNPPDCTGGMGYAHNASLFRRSAWQAVHGYTSVAIGVDAAMDGKLRGLGNVAPALDGLNDLADWFYVYRRGVSPAHLSVSSADPGQYQTIGERSVTPGSFTLTPGWRADYLAETQRVIADRNGAAPFPLVSCICCTYNRAPNYLHLVEETVESFLRQDYPNKELIIMNDTPGQELICDAPGVRIINAPQRFTTLGEKTNAAVLEARGDLLMIWDDDDINLPWRLSLSVARIGESDYYNPSFYWFLDGNGLHFKHSMGYAFNCSLFRRSAWEAAGRFVHTNTAIDREMDGALRARGSVSGPLNGRDELVHWFFIYRWGVSNQHLSGSGGESSYDVFGRLPIVQAAFTIRPRWREDYLALTRSALPPELQDQPAPRPMTALISSPAAPTTLTPAPPTPEPATTTTTTSPPTRQVLVEEPRQPRTPLPHRSLFFHPDQPDPLHLFAYMMKTMGWTFAETPEEAAWHILYQDETTVTLPENDPYADASWSWINGRCRDISKRTVERLFAEIFGYPLAVDPRIHNGPLIRKSNRNYVKDVLLLDGPIPAEELSDEFVYERLIDSRLANGGVVNLRAYLVAGELVFVDRIVQPDWISARHLDETMIDRALVFPDSLFVPDEIALIQTFAARAGLDVGALDIMRDNGDGRIYIFDITKTPGGFNVDNLSSFRQRYERIAHAFFERYPVSAEPAAPPAAPAELPWGRITRPLPHRSIFFYPARPDGSHILAALMARHGWSYAVNPDEADWCMLYLDETVVTLSPDDPWAEASWDWINGRCRDISKQHVDRVFAEIFGYQTSIDPLTYVGPCVQKANENYQKGAQAMLTCPLTPDQIHPGMVYQRFVDSHVPLIGYPEDHPDIIGGRVALVRRTVRPETLPPEKFFLDPRDESLTFADSIFTPEEQEQIARFCAAIGCDIAKLDVVRDSTDGRIYILDIAKTPGGSHPKTLAHRIRWEQRMDLWAQTLLDTYPSRKSAPVPIASPAEPEPVPAIGRHSVFIYPDQPNPNHLLPQVIERFGWTRADDPAHADFCVLYRDETWVTIPPDDPYAPVMENWVNGRCLDISKRKVQELFAELFGYPLAVDPLTHQGPLVRKGNRNFSKDVRILHGPLEPEEVHGRYVYQRLVESRLEDGRLEEFYTHFVGNRIATVTRVLHPNWIETGSLTEVFLEPQLVPAESVFTPGEQELLVAFCTALGLDLGKLDVIRDRNDGRLYVLDAAKTPGGRQTEHWDSALIETWLTLLARAIESSFCPRPQSSPPASGLSLFVHPDRPHEGHLLYQLMEHFGWSYADRPEDAELAILFRDDTVTNIPLDDPYASVIPDWVNGKCRDISKRRVQELFARTFGYPLAVDPLTHHGPILRKSNKNYLKDAVILQGPLAPEEIDDRYVYQRLVDGRVDDIAIAELHAYVVGGEFAATTRSLKRNWFESGTFVAGVYDPVLIDPNGFFSPEEQRLILAFCREMGLDMTKLDMMRDRNDGRLYIYDAAKTMGRRRVTDENRLMTHTWLDRIGEAVVAHLTRPPERSIATISPTPSAHAVQPVPTSIFFYPDRPHPSHLFPQLMQHFGWRYADTPDVADLRMLYRDDTITELAPDDPYSEASLTWINGRGRNISKRHVQAVFEQVFGYPLAVDPLTHHGPLLRKSNQNFVKDAVILQGPLSPEEIDDRYVYQHPVDGRIDDVGIAEMHVWVVGRTIATATRSLRRNWFETGTFVDSASEVLLVDPDGILSRQEQELIIAFCRAMGLDMTKLDMMRDRTSGRLYIYDATKTTGGRNVTDENRLMTGAWLNLIGQAVFAELLQPHPRSPQSTPSAIPAELPTDQLQPAHLVDEHRGRYRDISKRTVERVFEELFGYPLAVDPLTHHGPLLRKSNQNFVKDAVILQGPLALEEISDEFVYQRLIDSRIDDYGFIELIPYVVGNRIASVIRKVRTDWIATGAFKMETVDHQLVVTDTVFTRAEQAQIIAFCRAMGADMAELDVLRDREDGRIYVIDIAKTVGGQPHADWNGLNLDYWLELMREAVLADLPTPRPPRAAPPPIPALAIFAYPDRPSPSHLLRQLADGYGWRFVDVPAKADLCWLYRDETVTLLPPDDPYAIASQDWVNGRGNDISKRHIEAIFAEVFGYPLAVDPLTHQGPLLRKSNKNYVKDAIVLQGPLRADQIDDRYVYQRLVDSRVEGLGVIELHAQVIGGEIVTVTRAVLQDWMTTGRFFNASPDSVLVEPSSVLTREEQSRISAFCAAMGLQQTRLDLMRDRHNGRIYIYDATKTTGGWPVTPADRVMVEAFVEMIGRAITARLASNTSTSTAAAPDDRHEIRSVFFSPDRSRPSGPFSELITSFGGSIPAAPAAVEDSVLDPDDTVTTLPDDDPHASTSQSWVNGRRDISKRTVQRVFEEIFGYPLAVDPLTHHGPLLRSSAEGVVILQGPLSPAEIDDQFLYQRLVDSRFPSGAISILRTCLVHGELPAVERILREDWFAGGRPAGRTLDRVLAPPEGLFTADERTRILAVAGAIGLEDGTLDLLSDTTDGRLYIVAASEDRPADALTPRPPATSEYVAALRPLTLFFYPDRPHKGHLMTQLIPRFGWTIVDSPEKADLSFLFKDATVTSILRDDPYADIMSTWVNGRCRDISKRHVEHIVEQIFGYPLAVDPLTHHGPLLRKSNRNYVKDATVVQGPLRPGSLSDRFVYEHLADSRVDGVGVIELRVTVIGDEIVNVVCNIRPDWIVKGTFANGIDDAMIVFTDSVLSSDEQAQILTFCRTMGLDFTCLDIIRDRHDGRIYILDATKTTGRRPITDQNQTMVEAWLAQIGHAVIARLAAPHSSPGAPANGDDVLLS